MNLRHLEVFNAIMTSGSVTEAARQLNVAQPSVSAVLKHAESQLGVKLFTRVSGRLVPTPEAEALFPEVERIFVQIGILDRFTKDLVQGRSGYLALIGNPTLTSTLVPAAVARLVNQAPGVRVRVQTAIAASEIADRVARREFDLGLAYGPSLDVHTGTELLGQSSIVCALRSDHPLAALPELRVSDLAGYNLITFGPGSPIRNAVDLNFSQAGLTLNPVVQASFSAAACALAQEGVGIAFVDRLVARGATFRDLEFRPFLPQRRIELQLLSPKNRGQSRVSQQFAQALKKIVEHSEAQLDDAHEAV